MILEPWKSAEEIDRRLAALNDPELADLLRKANRELFDDPKEPYWNKRIAFVALAGLFAMSAGFSAFLATPRERAHATPNPRAIAASPKHHRAARPVHRVAPVPRVAARHYAPPVVHPVTVAPAPAPAAPAPSEAAVRRARAVLLHERALLAQQQAQARAEVARAEANAQELRGAIAQARAQARAEAIAQARAMAAAQAEDEQLQQEQQALLNNARDPNTKPGYGSPPGTGRMDTIPRPSAPIPIPGPIDPNCTPHRASLFNSALDHVRIGGTSVGTVLNLIHGP